MEEFTEELQKAYFSALYNQQSGCNEPMKRFKEEHSELFSVVNACYHKRTIIRDNMRCMKDITNKSLVFGALTYDNEHNEESEPTKRKQGLRHLNNFLDLFLFVEEHGELNDRYHLHFIGVLKDGIEYKQFHDAWHSYSQIEKVVSIHRAVNYLTDYVSKQAPRIRRNNKLIKVFKHWQKSNRWSNYGFKESFAKEEKQLAVNLLFDGL